MLPPLGSLTQALADAIENGRTRIGCIAIAVKEKGASFLLCHHKDLPLLESGQLELYQEAYTALQLARLDEDGSYRPLRSAPNVKQGWCLEVESIKELLLALEYFYPAALGTWLASTTGQLPVEHLRSKLARQTGMYQSAKFISSQGAQTLVSQQCGKACLKKVLWGIDEKEPSLETESPKTHSGEIPLYCFEACNLLVAEARKVSRQEYLAQQKSKKV